MCPIVPSKFPADSNQDSKSIPGYYTCFPMELKQTPNTFSNGFHDGSSLFPTHDLQISRTFPNTFQAVARFCLAFSHRIPSSFSNTFQAVPSISPTSPNICPTNSYIFQNAPSISQRVPNTFPISFRINSRKVPGLTSKFPADSR